MGRSAAEVTRNERGHKHASITERNKKEVVGLRVERPPPLVPRETDVDPHTCGASSMSIAHARPAINVSRRAFQIGENGKVRGRGLRIPAMQSNSGSVVPAACHTSIRWAISGDPFK